MQLQYILVIKSLRVFQEYFQQIQKRNEYLRDKDKEEDQSDPLEMWLQFKMEMPTPIKFKDWRSDQQTILKMHAKAI